MQATARLGSASGQAPRSPPLDVPGERRHAAKHLDHAGTKFSVPGSAQRWCGFRDWEVVGSLRASSEQAFAEALEHGSKSTMQLHKLRTFGTFLEYSPPCLALHSWRIEAPPAGRRRSSWPLAFGCCAIKEPGRNLRLSSQAPPYQGARLARGRSESRPGPCSSSRITEGPSRQVPIVNAEAPSETAGAMVVNVTVAS